MLRDIPGLTVTRIASGLPMGGDLNSPTSSPWAERSPAAACSPDSPTSDFRRDQRSAGRYSHLACKMLISRMSVRSASMSVMGDVFIGSEAITAGRLTRHELQRWYQPMFRGVYVSRRSVPTLWDRTVGAWLATRRHGVIAGNAASALHGAQWVDVDVAIELISPTTRPQHGLVIRRETLCDDEITRVVGLPVTTLARTAYDLGRHLSRGEAVARLDALMRATPFSRDDVLLLAKRHAGARGVRRLRDVLPLVDGGAASPKETWLRLLLIDAGLPVPTTQIPVVHRWRNVGVLDMGWEKYMVAAEYDGDQHRSDRGRYVKDQRRLRKLAELGWIVIRVIAEDNPDDVVNRVRAALLARDGGPNAPPNARIAVRGAAGPPRANPAAPAHQPPCSAAGRQAPGCGPGTARACRSRPRCPQPRHQNRRRPGCRLP